MVWKGFWKSSHSVCQLHECESIYLSRARYKSKQTLDSVSPGVMLATFLKKSYRGKEEKIKLVKQLKC